jgi:imidazolonepropionase-like amidohydrolase
MRQLNQILTACAALALIAATGFAAVPTPGAPEERPIALVGGTIHLESGADIQNGTLVFDRGKIVAVGTSVDVPAGAERIDVTGKQVYPSLIDPNSTLGLVEFDAARATIDYQETGALTPNVKAEVAFNPESESIPVTRSNGVLLANIVPRGNVLRGSSAMMMLDGWTWADMTLAAPTGMVLTWPGMVVNTVGPARDTEDDQKKARDKALKQIQDTFDQARAYMTGGKGRTFDARWEAMLPVLQCKEPLIVEANEIQGIRAAVAFCEREKVKMILLGGYDASDCADLLVKHDIPVIVGVVHRLPAREYEAYDTPFTVADRLRKAGVRFCIANGGGFWNERNLPYEAATCIAYGMPADEALKAITLYPAQILGVADKVGSLDKGKDATLFVSDGDILNIESHVEMAWVQGRAVDLNDKQKVLYTKYKEKYHRLGLDRVAGSGGGGGGKGASSPQR